MRSAQRAQPGLCKEASQHQKGVPTGTGWEWIVIRPPWRTPGQGRQESRTAARQERAQAVCAQAVCAQTGFGLLVSFPRLGDCSRSFKPQHIQVCVLRFC